MIGFQQMNYLFSYKENYFEKEKVISGKIETTLSKLKATFSKLE